MSEASTLVQPPPPTVIPISPKPDAETSIVQKIWQFFRQLFAESAPDNPQASSGSDTQPASTFGSFEQPEGQVSLQSAFYVERPPTEADCYETILQPGALIRIKAPRQMGKTSLLTRVLAHGTQQGCQTAYLNFQSADAEFFTSLDKFLQWFCGSIAQDLNLENKLTEYWQGVLGSKDKCTNYFQRYLLSEIHSPIVLGLDEVDQVFQYPQVASEFFGLLRAWHETSKNKETWKKLRLVIVHSKEVYIPLNINQSPFNVGLPIELPEFNSSQVQDLVLRHKLNWTQEEINQLMAMLGGHPYLVRKALHEIARGRISLSQLLKIAPTEEGFYNDHLRRHLRNLQEDSKLVAAMKQVVAATHPVRVETGLAFKLRSMGLVKFQGNDVMPLCDLYRLYFREHLGGNS
ncbi:MAG: AAA-like domain-containing protein [Brasilonema octagenarum HA4186-MV1]|nr:AAA-like domain-containing protein [Brasilonema octagenarum HA4186-MV1]